jgi:hypothetical protein
VRVWVASEDDAPEVTRLMLAFRDWWGRDVPADDAAAAGVARLLADDGTESCLEKGLEEGRATGELKGQRQGNGRGHGCG